MKTGIVVEGGGMRGIYAAGVLDVLLEHGIKADGLVGVSAGAIHGCSFVAGQAGRSIRCLLYTSLEYFFVRAQNYFFLKRIWCAVNACCKSQ